MDDLALGRVLRELRVRRQWTQQMVATRAQVSSSAYSEVERGRLDSVPLARLRRIAAALEVRLVIEPRWRGAGLERALSARHASMGEAITRTLTAAGWEVQPEVSFSHFGERGVVDLAAWHADAGTLLLVELKTELVDINGLLAVADRRRRLAATIVAPLGWAPKRVGMWIVIAESRTNRRRVAEHRTVLRAAFPHDGRSISGWLADPRGAAAALWFLPDSSGAGVRTRRAPRMRVRIARPSVGLSPKLADFPRGERLSG
jgi:transcriptional regulator with XRE-family HTH domain